MANVADMGFYDIPKNAIESFENWSKLRVALHDIERRLVPFLPPDRFNHKNPFCDLMKVKGFEPACYRFEVDRLRPYLSVNPEGCSKICHAGILEWTVPIMDAGKLSVVLFAGLRRLGPNCSAEVIDTDPSDAFNLWPSEVPRPRRVTPQQSHLFMEGLRQLAARLQFWMVERVKQQEPSSALSETRSEHRKAIIQRFIAEQFRNPITLADLSRALHLSRSRTAHLVVKVCGRTFGAQLKEMRLRHAAGVIRQTDCSILEAALDSGFGDVSNFHKSFRRQFGMTPHQYRRRTRI